MTAAQLQLVAGRGAVSVGREVIEEAGPRVRPNRFIWNSGTPALAVSVERSGAGFVSRLDGDEISTALELGNDRQVLAERALRTAFQIAVSAQGGVLVHAASVRFGEWAIVGVGHSTAGKSTLAGLCREAGGDLLSDEMTALFPDGTVYGTPFRSSDPTPGHPGPAKLGLLVLLEKAPHEALKPIAPDKAMPQVLAQVYRGYDGGVLTPAKILERVAGTMNVCPPQVLAFRKDVEAGHFIRRYLEAR